MEARHPAKATAERLARIWHPLSARQGARPMPRLLADVADDVLDRLADAESTLAALRAGRTGPGCT